MANEKETTTTVIEDEIKIDGVTVNQMDEDDKELEAMLDELFGRSTDPVVPETKPAVAVKKEKVGVISEADLKAIKDRVVFRMSEGVSDKYAFAKVCNISRQEKNTLLVILYLNENNFDRTKDETSFTEVTRDKFIAPISGVYVDTILVENFKISTKYFNRTEHFGKIVVSLSK